MITTVILEDEKNVGAVMRRMLETNHSEIKVSAVCYNIKEAEEAIRTVQPDLVLLDIELGKSQTSFDLLRRISPICFGIIFTTAYRKSALQALKLNAIDFLLKPIDEKELNTAIENFKTKNSKTDTNRIENLFRAWTHPGSQYNKMYVPAVTGCEWITVSDIVFCKSVNGQTAFVLNNKEEKITNLSLKECEEILTQYKFFRIHKSYLVNLSHVTRYINRKERTTVLSDNTTLRVSESIADRFLNRLKEMQHIKSY